MQSITENQNTGSTYILRTLCLLAFLLTVLCANRAFAQMDQGAITGTVVDATGAVIPAAGVTLTNTGTGLVLKAETFMSNKYILYMKEQKNVRWDVIAATLSSAKAGLHVRIYM